MSSAGQNDDSEPPKKRRGYKLYCDASYPFLDVPRSTVWDIANPRIKSGVEGPSVRQPNTEAFDEQGGPIVSADSTNHFDSEDQRECNPSKNNFLHHRTESGHGREQAGDCNPQQGSFFQHKTSFLSSTTAENHAMNQRESYLNSYVDGSCDDIDGNEDSLNSNSNHGQSFHHRCANNELSLLALHNAGTHAADKGDPDLNSSSDGSSDEDSDDNEDDVGQGDTEDLSDCGSHNDRSCLDLHVAGTQAANQGDPDPNSSPDGSSDEDSDINEDDVGQGDTEDLSDCGSDNDRSYLALHSAGAQTTNQGDPDPNSSPDGSSDEDSDNSEDDVGQGDTEGLSDRGSDNDRSCLPLHRVGTQATNQGDPDPNSSPDGSSDEGSDNSEDHHHPNDNGEGDIEGLSDSGSDDDYNSDEDAQNNPQEDNHHQLREQPPHPPSPPPPYHNPLRKKLRGEYSEIIGDRVAASRGEVLLNIQQYCKQHPIPLTAQEDLHKLINSMFYKEIIPETTYKLDKLYSAATSIRYYFFCSKCFLSFRELNHKTVRVHQCVECKTENIVHDLTKANFFIIIAFVEQLQLLLKDPEIAQSLKNPNEFPDNDDSMKDLYDGTVYKKFVASLDFSNGQYYLSLCACTDGTPLFKSSTLSIWPSFVIVNELPLNIRNANVLLAGLWFGRNHPQMDLLLEPFADYIVTLSDPGFILNVIGNVRHYKAYLLGVCVDSGARGSVQCVHSHTGESSCNWCLHPGEVEGEGSNARKFLQFNLEPAKRTVEELIRDGRAVLRLPGKNNHVNGVTGISPLLRCPKFDIVDGMILDSLHWASFGVSRRMGKLWLGETKKKKKKQNEEAADVNIPLPDYYVGTDETLAIINKRIFQLRPPREVRRRPRDLNQIHDYNAREWENWALYFSVPIFKNILPERFLKHWTLFVQALYLLMKSNLKKDEIKVADTFMRMYVDGVFELYGKKELNFNMHISNHAADNALRWGNAWSISTYAFENGNKILKSKINSERGIPHQIIRSLGRESALCVLRDEASTAQTDDFRNNMARKEVKKSFFAGSVRCMMPKTFSPSREEIWHCQQKDILAENFMECVRIIRKNVCYAIDKGSSSRTDNSFVCCVDGTIAKIRNIIANEMSGEVFLFVSKVRCRPYVVPALPRGMTAMTFSPFLYAIDLIEEGTTIISCETLETICVHMKVDCRFYKGSFVSVMANTSNVF